MLLKRKIGISMTVLFLSAPLLAQDCKGKVEAYAQSLMLSSACKKKTCKAKEVDQVTDLTGYPNLKKDELLYRVSIQDRFFEVVVNKVSCKKIAINEIGSSDDE